MFLNSLSQIQNQTSQDDSPHVQSVASINETIKLKVPSLQEKLQAKYSQEKKESIKKLTTILTQNHANLQEQRLQDMKRIRQMKQQDLIDLKKSMSDGQPKHLSAFKKMNKVLETFQKPLFLLPTLEEARGHQAQNEVSRKERFLYLKAKSVQNLEEPWHPARQVPNYFDNINLMKSPAEFQSVTSSPVVKTSHSLRQVKNNNIGSSPQLSIKEMLPHHDTSQSQLQDKKTTTQHYHLENGVKPTSANNLVFFQQELQSKNSTSQMSHGSSKQLRSQVYFNSSYKGLNRTSKEWINAYHEKEIFGRMIADKLDIKLAGNHIHFKPFKPTNTQGYELNKYISLDAGERELKQKGSDFFLHLEEEPLEIPRPKRKAQVNKSQS